MLVPLMNLLTLVVMACLNVNGMNFCAQPKDSRDTIYLPKNKLASLEPTEFYFVKDIKQMTIVQVLYGNNKEAAKPLPPIVKGCQINTVGHDEYYYEFSCKKLKKIIDSQ